MKKTYITIGILTLLIITSGLVSYKIFGYVEKYHVVKSAGKWVGDYKPATEGPPLTITISYFKKVWIALVFGILIAASIRTFVSPKWIARLLGTKTAWQHLIAGVAGMPLMLCSCCVAPIFSSVYESTAKLGPSIALMLASPGLNLAGIALTLLLFPVEISAARIAGSIILVFFISAIIGKIFSNVAYKSENTPSECTLLQESEQSFLTIVKDFSKNILNISLITLPLIIIGVVFSSLLIPHAFSVSTTGAIVAIFIVAAISILIALPTFFEIPLAILLLDIGLPGAAVVMLIAGPIINLPSLFVLARETNIKVSASIAASVWLISSIAGIVVTLVAF
ncbi:MAG: permease [Nitrospinae bacterium]|nr:permease [Nitrospinota bacterium]